MADQDTVGMENESVNNQGDQQDQSEPHDVEQSTQPNNVEDQQVNSETQQNVNVGNPAPDGSHQLMIEVQGVQVPVTFQQWLEHDKLQREDRLEREKVEREETFEKEKAEREERLEREKAERMKD
jgi:hypothetical protein